VGAVMVVDASALRYTDSHNVLRGQPIAMMGLKLDFLTTGCRYDLKNRVGFVPPPMVHFDPVDRRAPERPPVLLEPQEAAVSEDGGE
jgi:cyanophycinase-like exopeptidase